MILLFIPFAAILYWMYNQQKAAEQRIAILEQLIRMQKPSPVKDWEKPVDNFAPKKPATLRPGTVQARESEENVFEFDVKLV